MMPPAADDAWAVRRGFREALRDPERLLRFPGAFSPLVAKLISELGFDGVYVSGGALAADLGFPDIGLTTLSEVAARGRAIAGATPLPCLVDADTGFGEPLNAARAVRELEAAGVAGCHLEDQENPKRCGHLDHKRVRDAGDMVRTLQAASRARRDPNFLLIARTDARAVEGLDAAVERARAYVAAGADMIFPEALRSEAEFRAFREAIDDVPLMANMTEFGTSPLLPAETLRALGYDLVIYPVTTLRWAMGAIEDGLRRLRDEGTQEGTLPAMQTRARLYELLDYEGYAAFDRSVYDFEVPQGTPSSESEGDGQ